MFKRFAGAVLASVAAVISIAALTAQQPSEPAAPIRLRGAVFTPTRGDALAAPTDRSGAPARAGQRGDYLVQFQGPVLDLWKTTLASAGVEVLDYIPDFAFRVRMDADAAARVRRLPFVAWVGPFHPAYKLDPSLARNGRRAYVARLERGTDAAAVLAALTAAGVQVTARGGSLLMLSADSAQLEAVAQVAGVASVQNFVPRVKHNEYGGGQIMGSHLANAGGYDGSTQTIAIADTGLGGGSAASAHADLPASRVTSIFNWPGTPDFCFETIINDGAADVDTGHGTHVATAALGSGNAAGVGRGTAPSASLVFQSVENYTVPSLLCSLFYGLPEAYYLVGIPGDLGDLFAQAYDAGARIHSDSWGSEAAGAYTVDSESTDAFIWTHRDLTVTFSAGNAGVDFDDDGIVDPMSISSPATAKNVITVGASENDRQLHWECDPSLTYTTCAAQGGQNSIFTYGSGFPDRYVVNPLKDDPSAGNAEQMAAFSSRGPTEDGRIKPDVVAPGTWTLSGYSNLFQQQYDPSANPQNGTFQYDGWGFPADSFYKYMGGTSMAAPLVAGGAAVVRDYYQKAHSHAASAALVKATLINSAVDLLDENNDGVFDNAHPIPNIHEGWGRVDLVSATDGSHQFDDETAPLSTGTNATLTFPVASPGLPFKATVVWTDYPSSPSAAVNLVNDLDLTVTAPDGTTYAGNVFAGGWSVAGGAADRLNNVENVYIFAAAAGVWTVTVTGYNVPNGPQPFALVVDFDAGSGPGLPVVRASVVDATATEAGLTGGSFRVTRSGDTAAALTVAYTVGGTATNGSDYAALTGTVTIPDGQVEVIVPVTPLDDLLVESPETIVVSIAPDPSYSLGSPSSAIVTLTSDDLPPDLTVTSVTAPQSAAPGGAMSVTDATRNAGTSPAGPSETFFYLSINTVLDAADVFVGSRPVPALAAGATNQVTTPLTVPSAAPPGVYRVLAVADGAGVIPESAENNNVRASSGVVSVGPDLIVTAATAPATGAAGGTVLVNDTTKNNGAGTVPATLTTFYLSANAAWDAADVMLGSRPVPSLAGQAQNSASTPVVIPATTTVGIYYVVAVADAAATAPESVETNNVKASAPIHIGADLTVTVLTAPAAAGPGDAITVGDTTKNNGGGAAPGTSTTFHLSTNSSLDASDVLLGVRPVAELGGGAQQAGTSVLTIPAGTVVGTYYVLARADGLAEVTETSENNNIKASAAIKVGPDLTVLALAAPATGGAGEMLSVTDTVKNVGGGASSPNQSAFYLSVNGVLDAGDVELGRRPVPELAGGATDVMVVSLLVPPGTAPRSYYLFSKVDADGTVAEVLETNNAKASALVWIGPDLVVSPLTGPGTTVLGATIVVSDTTRNTGGAGAEASTTSFYLSTNSALDAADPLIGSRPVSALPAGVSETGPTSLPIPASLAPGIYYVIAKADGPGILGETIETNNTRVLTVRINP